MAQKVVVGQEIALAQVGKVVGIATHAGLLEAMLRINTSLFPSVATQYVVVGQETLSSCEVFPSGDVSIGMIAPLIVPEPKTLTEGVFSCKVDSDTLEVCDEDQPEDAIEVTASSPTINTIAVTVPIRRRISDSTLVPFLCVHSVPVILAHSHTVLLNLVITPRIFSCICTV